VLATTKMPISARSRVLRYAGYSAVLGAVFFVARWVALAAASVSQRPQASGVGPSAATTGRDTVDQIVVITLVGSNCGFSRSDLARDVLNGVRAGVSRRVSASASQLVMVGVDIDAMPHGESAVLQRMDSAKFDQVVLGGGWDNVMMQKLIWSSAYSVPLVPQVIVMRRQVLRTSEPHAIRTLQESHVLSVKGLTELKQWAASGFALPVAPENARISVPN
jgi:hypothetical protein